jgi:hypothetical protein
MTGTGELIGVAGSLTLMPYQQPHWCATRTLINDE